MANGAAHPAHHAKKGHHNKVKSQQDCDAGKTAFFKNLDIYQKMAKDLNTNADFLMTLSSHESGWLDAHNAGLHNLLGLRRRVVIT